MTNQGESRAPRPVWMIVLGLIGIAVLFYMPLIGLPVGRILSADLWTLGHHSWRPAGMLLPLLGIWGLIQIVLAIWVGVDANRRGLNGFLWGLLVLFTHIVGLIIYLIAAPMLLRTNGADLPAAPTRTAGPPAIRCVACSAEVEAGFKVCPYCGASMRCGQCEQPVRAGWKVCPHCATPIAASGT